MKKIMIMAAAVMMSLAANAQTSPEAKAIKKLKSYSEAEAAFKAAQSSMSPEDQAFCYNKLAEIAAKQANDAEAEIINAQLKKDEATIKASQKIKVEAAYNALQNAQKAFALNPKAVKVAGQLQSLRNAMIDGGLDAYNAKEYATAENYFGTYVEAKENPLYSKIDFAKETGFGQIAYYAGLASYFNKDYKAATKYAEASIANPDTATINDAITLKVSVLEEYAKTSQIDTLKFIEEVKGLYAQFSENDAVFSKLYTLYDESGDVAGAKALAQTRLSKNANDVMANALLGQSAQNQKKYDEAISAYVKALAAKPDFLVLKNQLGVCYLLKAADVIDANTDARGNIKDDLKAGVIADLENAKKALEECKAADPDRLQTNWSYALERTEYILENLK